MVYIIDSRRMDLKHFQKVSVLKNCYPIGYKSGNDDNESDQTEFTLDFTCDPYQNIGVEEAWKSFMRSHCNDLTETMESYETYMTPSITALSNNLPEAVDVMSDIPDERISEYLNHGFSTINLLTQKKKI